MWEAVLEILVLLFVANGAPILVARLFHATTLRPVDLGARLSDGNPVFGKSKTWVGLAASLLGCALTAPVLGYTVAFGLIFAGLAMSGDLFSSFVKRRRGLAPSHRSLGLDQIPEALLPSLYAVPVTGLSWWWTLLLPVLFTLLQILVSQPLYHLKIRKHPH